MGPSLNKASTEGIRRELPRMKVQPLRRGPISAVCGGSEWADSAVGWPRSDQFGLLQPQINANGIHVWPFNSVLPLDLRMLTADSSNTVQKNRHDYFEVLLLCSGAGTFLVEDSQLPMQPGDLAVVGSTRYHTLQCPANAQAIFGVLYFDPNLIRSDGSAYSMEYLAPFLQQGSDFPHVLPASTGIPGQVFDLMRMVHAELPGSSMRGGVAIKTYLKMILMLLVNHYSSYAVTQDAFRHRQRAMDRIHRFFEFLPEHIDETLHVADAARLCHLTEADFVCFLWQATGRSFRNYLNFYRVERAKEALADTSRAISDIAQELGFCDQSYFGAVFHKVAGMTPLAYRLRSNGGLAAQPGRRFS